MGFAGGFASLLVLRVMLGVGESIAFPGSSKIIARHVPRRAARHRQCSGRRRPRARPGRRHAGRRADRRQWGWRAMFFVFGLATLIWLLPWQQTVRALADDRPPRRGPGSRPRAARQMAVVVDVDRPCARQLLFLFPARLAAAVPGQVARLHHQRDDPAGDARLCGAGGLRAGLRPFLGLVDALGPFGSRCAAAG